MNKEQELTKAMKCLYIVVDANVADDINHKITDYIQELKTDIQAYRDGLTKIAGHRKMEVANPARALLNQLKKW